MPEKVARALATFVERVRGAYADAEVYLFGSYARGTWVEDSDVDVVVVSERFRGVSLGDRARALRRMAPSDVPFQIVAYTPEELGQALRRSGALADASEYWVKLTP